MFSSPLQNKLKFNLNKRKNSFKNKNTKFKFSKYFLIKATYALSNLKTNKIIEKVYIAFLS